MSDLLVLLFFVSFFSVVIFLFDPALLTKWFKLNFSRKKILSVFGGLTFLLFILIGATPDTEISDVTPQEPAILGESQGEADQSIQTEIETEKEELFLVTRIIDGDTIELENGKKVRYIGIDTPEKGDCYTQQATNKNKELVLNKKVKLEKDVSETDRYDRLLRYVYIDDVFVNQVLVAEGYAQASSYPPDVEHQAEFKEAEEKAREEENGLWGEVCNPKPSPTPKPTPTPTLAPVYVPEPTIAPIQPKATIVPTIEPVATAAPTQAPATNSYSCNCSKTCPNMSSCDEAYYQLNNCGCSVRDGDDDGVPCESICPGG